MATIYPQRFLQGTLDGVNNLVLPAPFKYDMQVTFLFRNDVAYDLVVTVNRLNPRYPPSTAQLYSLTLDPGDTVETGSIMLFEYDSIEISTTTPGTTYAVSVVTQPTNPS
jgi:hypothetical protein